jgi:hypothetical protein
MNDSAITPDLALLDEVIAAMRAQLEADQRGELPAAMRADGTPVEDPQIAFFARMMRAPSPIPCDTINTIDV